MQASLTEQRTTLAGLTTSAANTKETLAAVQTALSDIKTAAAGIRSVVDKHTTALSSLQADVTALKKTAAAQSTELAEVHTAVDKHTTALSAIQNAATAVYNAVQSVNQTYVDALKEADSFDKEAQAIAFNKALTAAKKALTQETIQFIRETFGDLDGYLSTLIESQVRSQKTYM